MAPHLENNVYNRLQESAYEEGVELLGQQIEVNEELGRVPDKGEIKRHTPRRSYWQLLLTL